MLINAILGFLLGYAFVALLPYLWLGLKVLWELITAIADLLHSIYELVRYGVEPIPSKSVTDTPNQS